MGGKHDFRKPDFRSNLPARDPPVGAQETAGRRGPPGSVTGIAHDGGRKRRQPDLRKHAVDRNPECGVDPLVEELRALNLIVAADADMPRDAPPQFRVECATSEIEAGPALSLESSR